MLERKRGNLKGGGNELLVPEEAREPFIRDQKSSKPPGGSFMRRGKLDRKKRRSKEIYRRPQLGADLGRAEASEFEQGRRD